MSAQEKNKTASVSIKHIQHNVEGDFILGSDSMASFVGKIHRAGYNLNDVYKIGKDGIIFEIKPVQIDDPEIVSLIQTLFMNQLSLRSIVDNQSIARLMKQDLERMQQIHSNEKNSD